MQPAFLLLAALLGPVAAPPPVRATPRAGTVTGALRYKGCPSAPAGATVSVIGREASASADGEGRFGLTLPPGTYSLVFGGPGLVADQRLDDVAVAAGQARDLGTIEVWPEERPSGCTAGPPPAPSPGVVVATAPDLPALELPGAAVAPSHVAAEQVWVRGPGGSAPGQFGLAGNPAHDDEDAFGPPTFGVGPQGTLWVVDALNWRVQRFDGRGHPSGGFALVRHGEEPQVEADLAVSDEGHVFLFTAGEPPLLTEQDPAGRLLVGGALPPAFKGVELLFAVRQRPTFLMQNGQAVRAELGWGGLRPEGPWPGLPVGDLYVHAERLDRWRAVVKLSSVDGRPKRTIQLHSRVPISGVRTVGVERRGGVVLALDRAEAADDAPTPRAEVLLIAVDQHGHLAGSVAVPPGGRRFEFREFALGPDNTVVQMQSDTAEVRFVRWTLRPPPPEAVAGEGLVRGRVVAPGRPPAEASVSVGKLHRSAAVASDGSFELRLPAGNWLLSVRRPATAGEAAGVEVKVAVAAGSTVDIGTVTLPRGPGDAGRGRGR